MKTPAKLNLQNLNWYHSLKKLKDFHTTIRDRKVINVLINYFQYKIYNKNKFIRDEIKINKLIILFFAERLKWNEMKKKTKVCKWKKKLGHYQRTRSRNLILITLWRFFFIFISFHFSQCAITQHPTHFHSGGMNVRKKSDFKMYIYKIKNKI